MELDLECSICCSDFDKKNPSIRCPANDDCGLACRRCFFRFINEKLTPSCMFCNSEINDDFIKKNSNKKEYDEYKNTRVAIVLSREKSLLPQTQEKINLENEYRNKYMVANNLKLKLNRKRKEIYEFRLSNPDYSKKPTKKNPERKIVYDAYSKLLEEQKTIADIYWNAHFSLGRNNYPQESVVVTINCPTTTCRGFLSSAYKCGICETYFCPSCHVRKDERNSDNHVCNEDDKATILLLKKDTKPCPKCRTPISKIDGCDQIFCIVRTCQTAFSWKTGKIDNGPIHNPEFFRLMREMGIAIPRNPLDVIQDGREGCGNNIFDGRNYWNIRNRLLTYNVMDKEWVDLYRECLHVKLSIMTKLPSDLSDLRSEDLRVKYLKSEIDQEKWSTLLKRRMKKNQKNNEVYKMLYLFLESVNEFFWFFINQIKQNGVENGNDEGRRNEVISEFHSKISEIKVFINKEILVINKKYESTETFYLYGFSQKR